VESQPGQIREPASFWAAFGPPFLFETSLVEELFPDDFCQHALAAAAVKFAMEKLISFGHAAALLSADLANAFFILFSLAPACAPRADDADIVATFCMHHNEQLVQM
jgi:hypothetical protein